MFKIKLIYLTCVEEAPTMSPLLWRWWTAAKVLSIDVTVALPVQGSFSLSILPQTRGQTRLNFLPLHFLLFRTILHALRGGSQREQGRDGEKKEEREGPPWGHPSPLILPLITVLTVSPRLNNNRGSSLVASLCVLIMFTGRIITQAGRRAHAALSRSLYN